MVLNKNLIIFSLLAIFFFFNPYFLVAKTIILGFLSLFHVISSRKADLLFLLYIIFIFVYVFNMSFYMEGYLVKTFSLFFPILSYSLGSIIAKRIRSLNELKNTILIFSLSLAFYYIIFILIDIYQNGFLGDSRSISLSLSESEDSVLSATVIGGAFTPLIAFLSVFYWWGKKIIYLILLLIVAYCSLRLGSRTQLFLIVLSLFIGLFYFTTSISLVKKIFYFSTVITLVIYSIYYIFEKTTLSFFFQDRMNSEYDDTSNLGGRSDIWLKSFEMIWKHPFGWANSSEFSRYAHNLWLDIFRVGGVISFFMYVFITILVIFKFYKIYKNLNDISFKSYIFVFGVGMLLLFMVEPILDGFIYPLSILLLNLGLLSCSGFLGGKNK